MQPMGWLGPPPAIAAVFDGPQLHHPVLANRPGFPGDKNYRSTGRLVSPIVLVRRERHAQTSPDLTRAHPIMVKPQ